VAAQPRASAASAGRPPSASAATGEFGFEGP
jgi:hypothetical protein